MDPHPAVVNVQQDLRVSEVRCECFCLLEFIWLPTTMHRDSIPPDAMKLDTVNVHAVYGSFVSSNDMDPGDQTVRRELQVARGTRSTEPDGLAINGQCYTRHACKGGTLT